jgi:CubicO group peptidase (beta-lactamase class C family)
MYRLPSLCLIATLLPPMLPASAADVPPAQILAPQIDAAVRNYYRPDGPGATIIVTYGGRTMFRQAYGLADVAAKTPMTPETVLRIASVTKQFTAVAVLMLEEEGRLALTDDVTKHLPGYPASGRKVTIEHLLTHTSGIPNYTALPDARAVRLRDMTVQQMIDRFKDLPLEFEPGSRFAYSNSGYFLLGAIIEKVSGQPFATFLERRIFLPLGMQDTAYEGHERRPAPHATGYSGGPGGFVAAERNSMTQPYAAGGLVSTVDDLARWDAAIADGKLLKAATWQRAFTPYALTTGKSAGYGYGWGINELLGQPAVSHSGGIDGFSSHAMFLPRQRLFVAVLQNADSRLVDPDVPARKAAAIVLGKPYPERTPAALDASVLQAFVGRYGSGGKTTHTVRLVDGALVLQRGGPVRRLLPYSPTGFMVENTLVTAEFTRAADGKVNGVRIDDTMRITSLDRTGDAPARQPIALAGAVFDPYQGRYQLAPGMELAITRDGERFYGQATGQPRVEMKAMSERAFFSDEVDAELEFFRDDSGKVDRLVLRQHGREMPATRIH